MRRSSLSLNTRVWRLVLIAAGGSLALWAFNQFFSFDAPLLALSAGVLALITWAAVVRMLLLDARFRIFWLVWLLGGLALLLALPITAGIWVAPASFAGIFLLFRKYKPYSHLTPRRRAALFLIALLMFGLLVFGMLTSRQEEVRIQLSDQAIETTELPANTLAALGKNLFFYGISALQTFWFLSLFHLFFRRNPFDGGFAGPWPWPGGAPSPSRSGSCVSRSCRGEGCGGRRRPSWWVFPRSIC